MSGAESMTAIDERLVGATRVQQGLCRELALAPGKKWYSEPIGASLSVAICFSPLPA